MIFVSVDIIKREMTTKLLILILTFMLTMLSAMDLAYANSPSRFCTVVHISEAIKINQERRSLYAELTQQQSHPISHAIIQMELNLLDTGYLADFIALFFQGAGIPILCDEYVSMDLVPNFKTEADKPWPLLKNYKRVGIQKLKTDLEYANNRKDFAEVLTRAQRWLNFMAQEPQYNCLTRHFIESIARAAALAPQHNAKAAKRGLSTLEISKRFISAHLELLSQSQNIDQLAAPIQASGVPIICQDIPVISLPNINERSL